jgi:HEAT repeat protein
MAALPYLQGLLGRRGILRRGASRELRICAALALGEIGGPEARALLEENLADRDSDVRHACAQAMARGPR